MAGKRVISAVLSLKDKDFGSGVKKASKGTKDFERKVKYAGNQVKQFGKSAVSNFSNIAKSAAGLAVAYVGFSKLTGFMGEGVEAAKSLMDVQRKLQWSLKNVKGVTDLQIESVKNYAGELANAGVVGKEVTLSGVQQLSMYKLHSHTLKKLMPGMENLLVKQKGLNATQDDAIEIGKMFGEVMAGNTDALTDVGISFTKAEERIFKYGTESQKAALLAQVLEKNVGGVNAEMAKTDEGQIHKMKNAWSMYKVEVGKKVLSIQAKFAGWFSKHIPKIQNFVLGAMDKFTAGFGKVEKNGVKVFKKIKDAIQSNKPVIDTVKNTIYKFGSGVLAVKDWAVNAFQNIKERIQDNKPILDGVKSIMEDMGDKALDLKGWLVSAFDSAKPALNWLKDKGLPLVVDGIAAVIKKATDTYNFINNNWNKISPIVYGVAGAILFYKAVTTAVSIATTIWSGVTWAMTAAQGAFNAVLAISPLGWVAIAIGAVIAVGVLLYKNWDTVKEKATALWDSLTGAWTGIKDGFKDMWTGMKESAKGGVNFIIEKLNGMIEGFNNFASYKIPDWVPGVGGKGFGANIPTIPQFAKGTSYAPGGLAQINECGGEIVDLPNGSRVYPHDKSIQMARSEGGVVIENITIQGTNLTVDQIANELVAKIRMRLANM
ncbi:hypothetical protein A0U40_05250 [[Bacillus] sp. KCTC 13219]|nr:hypothetical protein A0U40_05250 [[Bacillus] sp. KCTC 13219]